MPNPNAKLTDDEQYQVCRWYGEFKSPTQIKGLIKDHFAKDLTLKNVWAYANGNLMKKWKPLIESYRQRYVADVTSIPLFHQRVRLQRLEVLWDKASALPETKADEARKKREELRAILKEARDETQKAVTHNTNLLIAQFGTMDDRQLIEVRDKLLNRLTKIRIPEAQDKETDGGRLPAEQVAQEVTDG
mgnify:CR=1 FL=1